LPRFRIPIGRLLGVQLAQPVKVVLHFVHT
jgi:hypothetical protein